MRAIHFLAVLAVALSITASAQSAACPSSDPDAQVRVWTTVGSGQADTWSFYIVTEMCDASGCLAGTWVYRETNGYDGLQRLDELRDDTCGGLLEPDTLML